MGATTRDRQKRAEDMLKQLEQLPDVEISSTSQERAAEFMDTTELNIPMQQDTCRINNQEQPWQQQQNIKNKGKATTRQLAHSARQSEGNTSPERRAYSAPVDPHRIKLMTQKRFQPL